MLRDTGICSLAFWFGWWCCLITVPGFAGDTYLVKGESRTYTHDCEQNEDNCPGAFRILDTLNGNDVYKDSTDNPWTPTYDAAGIYLAQCRCGDSDWEDVETVYVQQASVDMEVVDQTAEYGTAFVTWSWLLYGPSGSGTGEVLALSDPDSLTSPLTQLTTFSWTNDVPGSDEYGYVTNIDITSDSGDCDDSSPVALHGPQPGPNGSAFAMVSAPLWDSLHDVSQARDETQVLGPIGLTEATVVAVILFVGGCVVAVLVGDAGNAQSTPNPALASGQGKALAMATGAGHASAWVVQWWLKNAWAQASPTVDPQFIMASGVKKYTWTAVLLNCNHSNFKGQSSGTQGGGQQVSGNAPGKSAAINNVPGRTHSGAVWYPYSFGGTRTIQLNGTVIYHPAQGGQAAGNDLEVNATILWP